MRYLVVISIVILLCIYYIIQTNPQLTSGYYNIKITESIFTEKIAVAAKSDKPLAFGNTEFFKSSIIDRYIGIENIFHRNSNSYPQGLIDYKDNTLFLFNTYNPEKGRIWLEGYYFQNNPVRMISGDKISITSGPWFDHEKCPLSNFDAGCRTELKYVLVNRKLFISAFPRNNSGVSERYSGLYFYNDNKWLMLTNDVYHNSSFYVTNDGCEIYYTNMSSERFLINTCT